MSPRALAGPDLAIRRVSITVGLAEVVERFTTIARPAALTVRGVHIGRKQSAQRTPFTRRMATAPITAQTPATAYRTP